VQALLHLLAHQGMADLGRQAELMSQVVQGSFWQLSARFGSLWRKLAPS
jgi:hypothetical protein